MLLYEDDERGKQIFKNLNNFILITFDFNIRKNFFYLDIDE
jgi:hypothetical protein